jgi:hypothetical protein
VPHHSIHRRRLAQPEALPRIPNPKNHLVAQHRQVHGRVSRQRPIRSLPRLLPLALAPPELLNLVHRTTRPPAMPHMTIIPVQNLTLLSLPAQVVVAAPMEVEPDPRNHTTIYVTHHDHLHLVKRHPQALTAFIPVVRATPHPTPNHMRTCMTVHATRTSQNKCLLRPHMARSRRLRSGLKTTALPRRPDLPLILLKATHAVSGMQNHGEVDQTNSRSP